MGAAMFTMIPTLNGWAERWLHAMGAVLWQSTLLIAFAAVIAWWLRRSSPVVRYWLWQIVAIKVLLMPFWTFALPLPSWAESKPHGPAAAIGPANDVTDSPGQALTQPPVASVKEPATDAESRIASSWKALSAITWQAWLLLLWIAAVLGQFLHLLIQRFRLAGLLRRGAAVQGELAGLVAELAAQVGLRRAPAIVSVAEDCPLFVCGLWRPRLVVPSRLMASLNSAERRQVILHELAHLKRRDLFWGWPVEIARMVYFFHPLVWWVAYQLRLERELACDQLAMARSGHPPADYAQTLVQVVSCASAPAALQAAAISAGLTGSESAKRKGTTDEHR
jgi:beta-lactamase regulating signal transducer with metallopeptidase domain